jgi:hypothetical protein
MKVFHRSPPVVAVPIATPLQQCCELAHAVANKIDATP